MIECLRMLSIGLTVPEIASRMSTSEPAVTQLIADACSRLRARNGVHAVNIAVRQGLV